MIVNFIRQIGLPILLLMMAFLPFGPKAVAGTHYPLTLRNCGRDITFMKKPQRAVAIGQNSAEILYLLGIGDRVQATALWFSPVLPQFAGINGKIRLLAANDPGFEAIVAERPDMIANQFESRIGPAGVVGTYAQFGALSIPVYTSPADCTGKDNHAGGDGRRTLPFSMEMIYQEITELAQIFDVSAQGEQAVAALRAREAAARARISGIAGRNLRAVFWYSSARNGADPFVAGRLGAPGYMMKLLGISNIVESDNEWPVAGWETVAGSNPDLIILADMTRRRFPADAATVKRHYLETDPVTRLMPAVRAGRIAVMDAQSMNPSIRVIDGLERLANALRRFGLEQ